MVGIAWVGLLTFVMAYFISEFINKITPPLDDAKSKTRIFLEVCLQFAIIGVIFYGSRILIKNIPFPFEGLYGYQHSTLGELRSLPLFVFIFMFFQRRAQDKMRFVAGT